VTINDFVSGISKTFFRDYGSYHRMLYRDEGEGGTQGVGRATTSTVVVALLLIIIGDFSLQNFSFYCNRGFESQPGGQFFPPTFPASPASSIDRGLFYAERFCIFGIITERFVGLSGFPF
jgi:hypothetical protein